MFSRIAGLIYPVCPACKGEGGGMSGYYQPEFVECMCCNESLYNEDDPTRVWRWRWWRFKFREWKYNRAMERQIAEWERDHPEERA